MKNKSNKTFSWQAGPKSKLDGHLALPVQPRDPESVRGFTWLPRLDSNQE